MRLTIDFAFFHVGDVIDHHILDSAFFAAHCDFRFPVLWESKVAMGREKGTIQNMMIDYITNVKKGKIDGQSHNRWEIIGLN